jgi:23S rRNA pseudouridine1911/1915/1917 synthase
VDEWQRVQLDRGDVGVRIDRVLLRHLSGGARVSRNRIQKLIAAGGVLINGAAASRVAWRVAAGDDVRVRLEAPRPRSRPAPEPAPLEVLYEDDDLLIVNKPSGIVSHPAFGHAGGTLLNAVLWHARRRNRASAPALLTRLDKFTSGAVLIATRPAVFSALQRAMRAHRIDKDYLAIVHGRPSPARGTIDAALDRDPWDRRRVAVTDRGGQPAVTRYERLGVGSGARCSLVRCRLVTGRMHQIRVHLASKGWPIVGDATYGRGAAGAIAFPRQALHAWRISLAHPLTGATVEVTAPLPPDMKDLAASLGLDDDRTR